MYISFNTLTFTVIVTYPKTYYWYKKCLILIYFWEKKVQTGNIFWMNTFYSYIFMLHTQWRVFFIHRLSKGNMRQHLLWKLFGHLLYCNSSTFSFFVSILVRDKTTIFNIENVHKDWSSQFLITHWLKRI